MGLHLWLPKNIQYIIAYTKSQLPAEGKEAHFPLPKFAHHDQARIPDKILQNTPVSAGATRI
jgi:hypothetical protein